MHFGKYCPNEGGRKWAHKSDKTTIQQVPVTNQENNAREKEEDAPFSSCEVITS